MAHDTRHTHTNMCAVLGRFCPFSNGRQRNKGKILNIRRLKTQINMLWLKAELGLRQFSNAATSDNASVTRSNIKNVCSLEAKWSFIIHSSYNHYTIHHTFIIHSSCIHHTLIIHSSCIHHTFILHSSCIHHTVYLQEF